MVNRISLDLLSGEVHALLGQNGSGKSTVIKIMTGIVEPDRPEDPSVAPHMLVNGIRRDLPVNAGRVSADGITAVHQDLPIIGAASVLENLQIGRYRTGLGWRIDWNAQQREVAAALEDFGINARPDQMAQELPAAERAMLAILRGLRGLPSDRPGLLILDEPTAHLPRDGVDRVTEAVRKVANDGHAVLLVTHRLDEVFAISDRISVVRDGQIRINVETSRADQPMLIKAILGFELNELYPEKIEHPGSEALSVMGLAGDSALDFSVSLRGGEIVGLTGLIGAGHEEVPYLLFGAKPARSGEVRVAGIAYPQQMLSPSLAMRLGLALLPNDRRAASGIGHLTVRENVTMPIVDSFFARGLLDRPREKAHTRKVLQEFSVNPPETELLLESLSGGNQQKALLAKWFQSLPSVLILHEPTQGVDIGSRRTIFQLIEAAAARGAAILIVSSEYADLANLCDRVLVMRRGHQVGELAGASLSEQHLLALCMMQ